MDYEQMSVQELRAECQARGLGTARSRADLIQRLTDHDTTAQGPGDTTEAASPAPASEATPDTDTIALPPHNQPGVFRQFFPIEAGGPDEETHLANRQTTVWAAQKAGWRTRGDAFLAATVGDRWVYEVNVREAT